MRAEDFIVKPDDIGAGVVLDCPVDSWCYVPLDAPPDDLGSLLDAARDHLANRHPTEGPDQ